MTDFKLPDFNEIERQRALKMKNTLLSPLQLLSRTPNSIAHFILFFIRSVFRERAAPVLTLLSLLFLPIASCTSGDTVEHKYMLDVFCSSQPSFFIKLCVAIALSASFYLVFFANKKFTAHASFVGMICLVLASVINLFESDRIRPSYGFYVSVCCFAYMFFHAFVGNMKVVFGQDLKSPDSGSSRDS